MPGSKGCSSNKPASQTPPTNYLQNKNLQSRIGRPLMPGLSQYVSACHPPAFSLSVWSSPLTPHPVMLIFLFICPLSLCSLLTRYFFHCSRTLSLCPHFSSAIHFLSLYHTCTHTRPRERITHTHTQYTFHCFCILSISLTCLHFCRYITYL